MLHVQLALGDKPRVERRRSSTGRVLCDNCGTGISDMYRCCGPCGMDVCLHCCKERRTETGQVRKALEPATSTPDLSSNSHICFRPQSSEDSIFAAQACAALS